MLTRVSKQYTPIERNHSYTSNSANVNTQFQYYPTDTNTSSGVQVASQMLNQIFSAFTSKAADNNAGGGTVQKSKDDAPKETSAEDVIKNALNNADIDYDSKSKEFKSHILNKYKTMMRVYGDNKPDEAVINQRLVNYAKGYEFHHFELLAGQGVNVEDYQLDTSNTEDKTQKYKDFGAQYVELYDKNGDGKADIWEIFHEELLEEYMITDKMDSRTAQLKAIETVSQYSKMSFEDINNSTDNSKEMKLLKKVMTKVGAISHSVDENPDLDNLQSISVEEAANLALTYSNFMTPDANISMGEYINAEREIAEGGNRFNSYMKHADQLLK